MVHIDEREQGEELQCVLQQLFVANLVMAPQHLDDSTRMLNDGARPRAFPVLCALIISQRTVAAQQAVFTKQDHDKIKKRLEP